MVNFVRDDLFLGWSKELGLLRVEWCYLEDTTTREAYYIIYYEKLCAFDNKQGFNEIVVNNIGASIPSFSSYYSYQVFETQKEAFEWLYNNSIFEILK